MARQAVKIQRGMQVLDLRDQDTGVVSDIQHEFNRYQLEGVSGWIYGIQALVIVPDSLNLEDLYRPKEVK